MPEKAISIDLDAYERLSRQQDGDSLSQVIEKYLPAGGSTAGDLLAALDAMTARDGDLAAGDSDVDGPGSRTIGPSSSA